MTQLDVIGLVRFMLKKELNICRIKVDANPSKSNQRDLEFFSEAGRIFEQYLDDSNLLDTQRKNFER